MNAQEQIQGTRCWVVGNGPSLRGFDFRRLDGDAVLGMNAAYRYWQEINWYPTYYCCLDDELVATHWRQIIHLVRSGKVKKAFVTGSLAEFDRTILGDERFVLLDQFIDYWYRMRGKPNGIQFIDSPYFASSQASKLTTGSHSVRFAAYLGYKEICLLGIDLRYVETIPEAEQVGEIALRIRETPKHNPNYFFDGYQQAGDRYNIPNPKSHQGDLHFASLRVVKDDFAGLRDAPHVVNCNAASRLYDERVFPYLHVDRALNDRPLSSVVVPTTLKERDALLNQLWLFQQDSFEPEPAAEFLKPDLAYVFNSGDTASLEDELRQCFDASERLKSAFRDPVFVNLGLTGEQDHYIRDYTKPAGRFGYKAGPNNQFFEILSRFSLSGHFMFLMESDCLPIRRGWLGRLQNLLRDSERFWILGSAYRGKATLDESYKLHVNGNAVYAAGDFEFQVFVDTFWRPGLERIVRANPLIAYDCALELLLGEAESRAPDNPAWRLTQATMHLIRYTDYIQNRSGNRDFWDTPRDLVSYLNRDSRDTYFLHGKPIAEAVAAMRRAGVAADPRSLEMPRLAPPTAVGGPKAGNPTLKLLATAAAAPATADVMRDEFPKLLLIDQTRLDDGTEAGNFLGSLLKRWPKDRLLQVCSGSQDAVSLWYEGNEAISSAVTPTQRSVLKDAVTAFSPDVIVYRPVPQAPSVHSLAMEVIHERDVPLISWINDDWPIILGENDAGQFASLDADWRSLLRQSAGAVCHGEAIGRALRNRYGVSFESFSSGIEPQKWPTAPKQPGDAVLIRYSGPLSAAMGLESLVSVARAVEQLCAAGRNVRMEIMTGRGPEEGSEHKFARLERTSLATQELTPDELRQWLCAADIVLTAYAFDDALKSQIRYAISTKLPGLLCSGAALFAIVPPDVAITELLTALDCCVVHTNNSEDSISSALRDLVDSPDRRRELSKKAIAIARSRYNLDRNRDQFTRWIREATGASQTNLGLQIARNAERRRWQIERAGHNGASETIKSSSEKSQQSAAPAPVPASGDPSLQAAPLHGMKKELPRVLLFDLTRLGDATATGELKSALFQDWKKDQVFQIFGGGKATLGTYINGEIASVDVSDAASRNGLKARIQAFMPDVILYRPVPDTAHLHTFAMEVISASELPLVTWIMDDWPAALQQRDAAQFEQFDPDLRSLFRQSSGALSIGVEMSNAFAKRYGVDFEPFANGIDCKDWDWSAKRPQSDKLLIRYSGSLAHDMGLDSILGVAQAVEALAAAGMKITFEIKTRKFWADKAAVKFKDLHSTHITTQELAAADYRAWLSGADIVLICYNFDATSKAYVKYSVANKLPECLASGAALLAVGPPDIAMMRRLRSLGCSVCVETPDLTILKRELSELAGSQEKREALAAKAREIVLAEFDMRATRKRFVNWLTTAADSGRNNRLLRAVRAAEGRLWVFQQQSGSRADESDPGAAATNGKVMQNAVHLAREGATLTTRVSLEQLSNEFGGIASSLRSRFASKAS